MSLTYLHNDYYRLFQEFLRSKMVIIQQRGCWKSHQQPKRQVLKLTSQMCTKIQSYTG